MSKQLEKIDCYIDQLKQYNETTNIYSKKAYDKLPFHIQDCIILAEMIGNQSKKVLDIGSGSGLPAVIIAIMNPKNQVTAIESKSRKTQFLEEIKLKIRLTNLSVRQENIVEFKHHTTRQFDVITAKAFAAIERVRQLAEGLLKKDADIYIPISQKQSDDYQVQFPKNESFIKKNNYIYYHFSTKKDLKTPP